MSEVTQMNVVVHKANISLAAGESLHNFTRKLGDAARVHTAKKFLLNREKGDYTWPVELFSDTVIMSVEKDRLPVKLYAMKYMRDGKSMEFKFGDPVAVERKTTFSPVNGVTPTINTTKAVWTAAFINTLPDSSFAVILPGGKKDKEGKTTPRSLRKLPFKDANGKVDKPHLRNALARLDQTDLPATAKATARRKLEAAAKTALPSSSAATKPKKTNKAVEQLDVSKGNLQVFGNEISQWVQTTKSFWGGVL